MRVVLKPLPVIYCKACFYTQDYRGQKTCIHCGKDLPARHLATQLAAQKNGNVSSSRPPVQY